MQHNALNHGSFLPRVHAVCALLAILFLTVPVPQAHAAPLTSISDLQYPAHVVLGASKYADGIPVTFQVHWTGARKNDLLLLGVLDDQTQDFAEGSTDITGCLSSRGGIVFEKKGRAYCALLLPGPSEGSAPAKFRLKLQQVGTHYLLAKAMLADSYGRTRVGSVSLSQKFSVEVTSSVSLTVKVPTSVTVTLDGVAQQTGMVSASVGPGSHTVSIPDLVPVDSVRRLRFDCWTDGSTSSNRLVTVEDDAQFEAVYVRQFLLTATSPYGNATGAGWYDEGASPTFSVVTPQPMSGLYELLGGKYVFSHWSGDSTANTPTTSVKMDGPKTVTAVWSMDYRTPVIAFAAIIIIMLTPLLYVFRKGKAAPIPPVQQPASPPAETVTQPRLEAVSGETPVTSTIVSPPATQRCGCGRSKEHLHYSSSHDLLVKAGLVFLLLAEGISFVQGAVKGWTTLYLENWEIQRYEIVMTRMTELTAPYEYLNKLAMGLELLTILIAIVAVATLHSMKDRNTHVAAITGAAATFILGVIIKWFYISGTDQALTRLPSMVDEFVLKTALEIEQRFQQAYGFWGTPAPDAVNIVFSLAGLALFVGAWITSIHFTVWQPTSTPAFGLTSPITEPVRPTVETSAVVAPTTVIPAMPTKFCRFCGARIPRVSKYCEECGARLT